MNRFIFLIPLIILLSCTKSVTKLYGFNKTQFYSEEKIIHLSKAYNIDGNIYQLDTNFYSFLKNIETQQKKSDSFIFKNSLLYKMAQPLILLTFEGDKQISCLNNCYTGGFPNLTWNKNGNLNSFPAVGTAPPDDTISLRVLKEFVTPISETSDKESTKPYSIFVFWNNYLGRQTKVFLKEAENHLQLTNKDDVEVYYINNDNFFNFLERGKKTTSLKL